MVDAAMAHDLAIGENILRHREIAEQVEFLEHHADAVAHGVGCPRKDDRFAVEDNAARRRPLGASDDLHQCRFAGPVLADEHVDRAAANLEIGLPHRDGSRIDLRHPLETQDHIRLARARARLGHGFGPSVISTGVTSGVSAAEVSG